MPTGAQTAKYPPKQPSTCGECGWMIRDFCFANPPCVVTQGGGRIDTCARPMPMPQDPACSIAKPRAEKIEVEEKKLSVVDPEPVTADEKGGP